MAYEPLHHKYRPQTFADLVGQEAIATTLSNALTCKRIAPAYLFSGPRGTGKTSSARILAKSLNCLSSDSPTPYPCGQCEVCQGIVGGSALDVIEIDAASNTGVDNIREIIERAQFAPVQCRYKVYVIDECHMLSQAAFNALLKTLEEPPGHVIFVLATTDPQRVLPTIISRCQRFDYRRIPLEAMVGHLSQIAQKEAIDVTDTAITLIAQLANGGLRDAESLLDQLSLLSGTVTPERVWDLVGAVPEQELLVLLRAVRGGQAQAIIEQCRRLLDRGREPLIVLQNLAGAYLNLLLAKTAGDRSDLATVTAPTWAELCQEAQDWNLNDILQGQQHLRESEVQIKNTTQPRLWLEVTLIGLLKREIRNQESEVVGAKHSDKNIGQNPISHPPNSRLTSLLSSAPVQESEVGSKIQNPAATAERESKSEIPLRQPGGSLNPITVTANTQLSEIWEAALQRLSLMAQALIRSHCHLLSLDENVANIGITTEPLLKHARTKVGELETAFQAILQRPISVRITVALSVDLLSETGNKEVTIQEPEISNQEASPLEGGLGGVGRSQEPLISTAVPTTTSTEPSLRLPEQDSAAEIRKAAESLAKSFEGEIVDLDQQMDGKNAAEIVRDLAFQTVNSSDLDATIEDDRRLQSQPESLQSTPKLIIQGRPNSLEIDEEDDIPF